MLRDYKKNFLSVILLSIGYILGILTLSLGISSITDARNYALDSTSGQIGNQLIANVNTSNFEDFKYNNVSEIFNKLSNKIEIQLLNFGTAELSNNKSKSSVMIVPVINSHQMDWHIPIIQGRYFSPEECSGNGKVIIIGKNLKEKFMLEHIGKNTNLLLEGEKFNVIGLAGRKNRNTQWDNIVYIPFGELPEKIKSNFDERLNSGANTGTNSISRNMTLLLRKNTNENLLLKDLLNDSFMQSTNGNKSIGINYSDTPEKDNSMLLNSIIITVLFSGVILIVATINVVNLSIFWVLDRRKEITIKKVVGATDSTIIKTVVFQMVLIAFVSAIAAILIQYMISIVVFKFIHIEGITVEVSWYNWVLSIGVSIICGLVSSISPIKATLKMQPSEALRID
jgi:putative ABC transport system permease protein